MGKNLSIIGLALIAWGQMVSADVMGEGYHGHMYGDGFGFVGLGMMLIFWAIVVVLAVLAYRFAVHGMPGAKSNSALDILRERLAKGEIDPEEFAIRRKALED